MAGQSVTSYGFAPHLYTLVLPKHNVATDFCRIDINILFWDYIDPNNNSTLHTDTDARNCTQKRLFET